jgi:hypothetical protein
MVRVWMLDAAAPGGDEHDSAHTNRNQVGSVEPTPH